MPKEIFPSSYECDRGHQSHFFANTLRDIKAMSRKKKVRLGDSAPDEHIIVFYKGEMVDRCLALHWRGATLSKSGVKLERRWSCLP